MTFKACLFKSIINVAVSVMFVMYAGFTFGQDSCPAVDCDCATLPIKEFQTVCYVKEMQLKKDCESNEGKPTSYCTISGLKGTPLPLALKFDEIILEKKSKINDINKQVAALYWSLRTDQSLVQEALDNGSFGRAQQILRTIDNNIDNLFKLQRRVTESWLAVKDKGEASDAWKDYVEDSTIAAKRLGEFGRAVIGQYDDKTGGAQRAYGVLGQKALSLTAKLYEHIAYGRGEIKQYAKAANALKTASELSKAILSFKEKTQAKASHISFYRNQTASRLHRASVYWVVANKSKEAKADLEASTKFFSSDDQFNALLKKELEQQEKDKTKRFGFF